ncbi:MAG: HNH endonuclease [Ilumatobacteraceae bacterium]
MIDTMWTHATPEQRERVLRRVLLDTAEHCWIWTGALDDAGYGRIRLPGQPLQATHRWSWQAEHGPTTLPVTRHICDIRPCLNPSHLIAGTYADNNRDTAQRGHHPRQHSLPDRWPQLAHTLRELARAGDLATIRRLTARPEQLSLLEPHAR